MEARRLRRELQLPIDDLARRLGISRSTVYSWVGDIRIPGSGSGGGFSEAARMRGTESMRANSKGRREWAYMEGFETFAIFQYTPQFRDFVAIYIASGYKGDPRIVSIAHPDPPVILLAREWLELVSRNPLRFQLQLAPGREPSAALAAWAGHLGVDSSLIQLEGHRLAGPAAADPAAAAKAVREAKRNPIGSLRLTVSDTLLRCELQAWIDCATAEWQPQSLAT